MPSSSTSPPHTPAPCSLPGKKVLSSTPTSSQTGGESHVGRRTEDCLGPTATVWVRLLPPSGVWSLWWWPWTISSYKEAYSFQELCSTLWGAFWHHALIVWLWTRVWTRRGCSGGLALNGDRGKTRFWSRFVCSCGFHRGSVLWHVSQDFPWGMSDLQDDVAETITGWFVVRLRLRGGIRTVFCSDGHATFPVGSHKAVSSRKGFRAALLDGPLFHRLCFRRLGSLGMFFIFTFLLFLWQFFFSLSIINLHCITHGFVFPLVFFTHTLVCGGFRF